MEKDPTTEKSIQELWANMRGRGRGNGEEIFEEIMAKNFPKLMTYQITNPRRSENTKQDKQKHS